MVVRAHRACPIPPGHGTALFSLARGGPDAEKTCNQIAMSDGEGIEMHTIKSCAEMVGRRRLQSRGLGLRAALLFTASLPTCVHAQRGPAAAAPQPAAGPAAPTKAGAPGDIIVTARRRSERARDVPIAIIAASQDELIRRGVREANDLPVIAPGLNVTSQQGRRGDTAFTLRGQGQATEAPSVITYFAEVPDFASQIYDLENVQVYKGPQGTLFGRNTTGGAVQLVPRKPEETWNGYALGRLGSYDQRDGEFGVGGGLYEDKVMVRLAGQYLRHDGYTTNLYDGTKLDNQNRYSVRASVVLHPVQWLENYTILEWDRANETGTGAQVAGINQAPGLLNPLNPALPFPGTISLGADAAAQLAAQQARGPRKVDVDGGGSNYQRSFGIINKTSVSIGDHLTIRNIFSDRSFHRGGTYDYDGTSLPLAQAVNPVHRVTERTEEAQAQFDWHFLKGTVGYYDERINTPRYLGFYFTAFNPYPAGAVLPVPQGAYEAVSIQRSLATSHAFYGELTARVTDRLALTAGARRTHDERSGGTLSELVVGGVPVPLGPEAVGAGKFNATTWNLNALYKVSRDLNVYATARRGYKAGGVNNTTIGPSLNFQPETVTDFEVGAKYSGLIGTWRVTANIDGFYDNYKNIQRTVLQPTVPVSTITQNAAAGKIKGIDVDLSITPNRYFTLNLTYAFLDTHYDSYTDPVLGDLSKGRFPGAPRQQFSIVPVVNLPLPERAGELSLQATVYYQSAATYVVTNRLDGDPENDANVPGSVVPGYVTVDLRADWRHIMGSRFSLAAFGRNLLNKAYVTSESDLLGQGPSYTLTYVYGAPRTAGVEARIDF